MNIFDIIDTPLVLKNIGSANYSHFKLRCKNFIKLIYEWDYVGILLANSDYENNCVKFIAFYCDISEKLVDAALPDYNFFKENGLDKTVKQFIFNLKKLASQSKENRFPKEEKSTPPNKKEYPINKDMEKKTHHVDIHNVGEHNPDNRFMLHNSAEEQYNYWKKNNPDCVPIGFCEEACKVTFGFKRIAFVFEDEKGNRYYVHVPEKWMELELK